MSKHTDVIHRSIPPQTIRAGGEAMGLGIAVTDHELVTARGGFGGGRLERYPLATLTGLRTLPNPHATLVEAEFGGESPRSLTFMYDPRFAPEVEGVVRLLCERAAAGETGARSPLPPPVPVPLPAAAVSVEGEPESKRNRLILFLMMAPLVGLYFAQVFLR